MGRYRTPIQTTLCRYSLRSLWVSVLNLNLRISDIEMSKVHANGQFFEERRTKKSGQHLDKLDLSGITDKSRSLIISVTRRRPGTKVI